VQLNGETTKYTAKVVGVDEETDLAVIKVEAGPPALAWLRPIWASTRISVPGIEYRRYDVTSHAQTDQLIDGVVAAYGKVDILVLGAGIIARTPLAQSTDEEWNSMLSVNVLGVVNPARKLFPIMCERGFGKILACGSIAAKNGGVASGPAYVASKAAVHGMMRWIAKAGAPHGVYANTLAPRPGGTAMWAGRHEQPGAGGECDRSLGPLRQRGGHRAGGTVPMFLPLPIGLPARRWISAAACGWMNLRSGAYVRERSTRDWFRRPGCHGRADVPKRGTQAQRRRDRLRHGLSRIRCTGWDQGRAGPHRSRNWRSKLTLCSCRCPAASRSNRSASARRGSPARRSCRR